MIDWIQKHRAKGYSQEQLSLYLSQQGYNSQEINEAFNPSIIKSSDTSSKTRTYILAIIIIVLIVSAGVLIFFLLKNSNVFQQLKLSSSSSSSNSESSSSAQSQGQSGISAEPGQNEEPMQTYVE